MITFMIFVLWKLNAPWWIYLLSIIGILSELDNSNLASKDDIEKLKILIHDMYMWKK